MWRRAVGPTVRMLDEPVVAYPRRLAREARAEALGMTARGSTLQSHHLLRLRVNGLVEVTGEDVRAGSDTLVAGTG